MAVTITKVTGIGGNPPTHIQIEGTVSGCEKVYVTVNCTTDAVVPIDIHGGTHTWSITYKNDKGCGCGTPVIVSASCVLGMPAGDTLTITLPLICDNCPTLIVTADPPGPCVNGNRSVTFHASVSGIPAGGADVLQWGFPNSTHLSTTAFVVTSNGPLPDQIVEYVASTAGSVARTADLQTILPADCPPVSVTVTIDPCPSCCPNLTLSQPTVTGCAPGSAAAIFAAVLTWPTGCTAMTPSAYAWTLDGPGGKKYQRSTSQPNTDTSTPWTDVVSGNLAAVQFANGGNYSVSVTATFGSGIAQPCNPTDTAAFTVANCCPTFTGQMTAQQDPNNPCQWIFSAQVDNPNGLALQFDWTFENNVSTATTSTPVITHVYPPGFTTPDTVKLTMTVSGATACAPLSLSTTITPSCACPTVGIPSATVTVTATGVAKAAFSTSVSPAVATSFDWTVTTPGGVSTFTKTTTTSSTTEGTADGQWTNSGSGAMGVLDLTAPGSYTVTVKAKGPTVSSTCPQAPPNSFIVPSPPTTMTPSTSCSIWCILAGIFFIAIPISAYISTVAHCLVFGWNIALQGAIISFAIGVFIALCGICCLWVFLLIGAGLGIVATLIAAIWLGFPGCWLVALLILLGFVALGIGMAVSCKYRVM